MWDDLKSNYFPASSSSGTCSKPRCGRLGMVPGSNRPTAPSLRSRPLKSLGQWSGGQIRNCFGAQAWYLCDISWTSFGWPLHRLVLFCFLLVSISILDVSFMANLGYPANKNFVGESTFPFLISSQQTVTRARHLPNQGSLDNRKNPKDPMAYVIIFHGHHLASFCPVPTLPHTPAWICLAVNPWLYALSPKLLCKPNINQPFTNAIEATISYPKAGGGLPSCGDSSMGMIKPWEGSEVTNRRWAWITR